MIGYNIRATPSLGRMINKFSLVLVLAYALVQDPIADAKPVRLEGLKLGRYNALSNEWDSGALDMRRRDVDDTLLEDGPRVKGSRHAGALLSSEEELRLARKERNRILSGGRFGVDLAKDSGIRDGAERRGYSQSKAKAGGVERGDEYGFGKNVAKKSRHFSAEDNLEDSFDSFEMDSLNKFDRFSKKRGERKKFYGEDDVKENFKATKRAQNGDRETLELNGNAGKKSQLLIRERTGSYDVEDDTLGGGGEKSRVGSRTSHVRGAKPRARQDDDDDFSPAGRRGLRSRAAERDQSTPVRRGDTDDEEDYDDLLIEEDNELYDDSGLKYESKPKQSFGQKKTLGRKFPSY